TPTREHRRHISLFEFHEGTAAAAAETLKDTYGNDVVNEKTHRKWFSAGGFEKDDLSLKNEREMNREQDAQRNSIPSSCKLALMKIQPTLLENWATFHVGPHLTIYREMKRLHSRELQAPF
ncbi:unnamed protein product, partial [Hymenolepis diminuta]